MPVHMCIHVDGFIDNHILRSLLKLIYQGNLDEWSFALFFFGVVMIIRSFLI